MYFVLCTFIKNDNKENVSQYIEEKKSRKIFFF